MKSIFVSSTFKDMQAERDLLGGEVLSELRDFARKHGEDIEFIDLRWGVDTSELESEEGAHKILSVCLDEIERTNPYMLILLGERYGWIPEKKLIENATRKKQDDNFNLSDLEDLEKSVTALEIEYGALSKKGRLDRCLFYYRDPIDLSLLPTAQKKSFLAESADHAEKLKRLKERINKATNGKAKSYSVVWNGDEDKIRGLEAFAEMVKQDITRLFEQEFKDRKKLSWQENEEQSAWLFVDDKCRYFSAHSQLLEDYKSKILNPSAKLFILRGEAGSGKSTIMSKLAQDFKSQGLNVLPIVCGQSTNSSSALDIMKQAVYRMETLLGKTTHFSEDEKKDANMQSMFDPNKKNLQPEDWRNEWTNLMVQYGRNKDNPHLIFTIDALDQLIQDETAEEFKWIPDGIPANVKIAISCLSEYKIPSNLSFRVGIVEENLPLLTSEDEKRAVIKSLMKAQRKELNKDIEDRLISMPQAGNPLYISMMLQRLLMLDSDDFKGIKEYGDDMRAINKYMLELIDNAPQNLNGVCAMILEEAAQRINEEQSRYILKLLSVSRRGLRDSDLKVIFEGSGKTFIPLDYYRLKKYMLPYFSERKEGQTDFTHRTIRLGFLEGMSEPEQREIHEVLYGLLESLPDNDTLHIAEYVYQAYQSDKKAKLVNRIEGYEKSESEMNLKSAAGELHEICMNDNGKWLLDVLSNAMGNEIGNGFIQFINFAFYDAFTLSMKEMAVLLAMMEGVAKYAEQLAAELGTPESKQNLTVSYDGIGNIRQVQGDLDGALELYEKSLEIREQLVAELGTPDSKLGLTISYDRIGYIRETQGDLDGALELFEKSLEIREQLAAELGTPDSKRGLAVSYNWLGGIRQARGDLDGALELFEKILAITEQLAAELGTPESKRGLTLSYNRIGIIRQARGGLDGALELFEKSLEIREQLATELGTHEGKRDLAEIYNRIGGIREAQGDLDAAFELFEKMLAITEQLAAELETPESKRNLAISYARVGNIRRSQGNLDGALELYEKDLQITEQLAAELETPSNKRSLAISYDGIGYIRETQGNLDGALELFEKSLEIREQLAAELGTPENKRDLALSYERIGNIRKVEGNLDGALELFEKSLEIREQLAAELGTPENKQDLAVSHNKIGAIRQAQGDLEGALEFFDKMLAIAEQLAAELETPESKQNLAASYNRIGDIREVHGDLDGALELFEKSLEIREQLAVELATPENKWDLVGNYNNIGIIRQTQGDLDGALELFEKMLAITEQLAAELGTPESKRVLALSYGAIGGIREAQGDLEGALEMYEKAMADLCYSDGDELFNHLQNRIIEIKN